MHVQTFQCCYLFLVATLIPCVGCQSLTPQQIARGQRHVPEELVDLTKPQVEVGQPNPLLDGAGWVLGAPGKLILWDRRVDNHDVSRETIEAAEEYLADNDLEHVKVRVNQYAPWDEFNRLTKNKTVAWPYRYSLGLFSVAGSAVIPGRLFGGDNFNPYTQTINLYSDVPAIALHEGAHAKDFSQRKWQGTYAAAYIFAPLWHEGIASGDALAYVHNRGDRDRIKEANRILYPAYGSYVGNAIGGFIPTAAPFTYVAGIVAGHSHGRSLNRQLDSQETLDAVAYNTIHQESASERPENAIAPEDTRGIQAVQTVGHQSSSAYE